MRFLEHSMEYLAYWCLSVFESCGSFMKQSHCLENEAQEARPGTRAGDVQLRKLMSWCRGEGC
jgi:hypothetical protein